MIFKKSLRLAFSNYKVLLKSLFFQLLSFALSIAICLFAFSGITREIIAILQANDVSDFFADVVQRLVNNNFDKEHFLQHITEVMNSVIESIKSVSNMWDRIEISAISCLLLFFLYRMMVSAPDVAAGCQLNEFMDSNSDRPFFWFLFKKAGQAWGLLWRQLLLAIVCDTLIIFGCVSLAIIGSILFGWWAIILVAIVGIALYTSRLSLMAFCLPSVVLQQDKRVGEAFADGISLAIHNFKKVFLHNLLIVTIMVVSTTVAYLFNMNRWLSTSISAVVNFLLFFIIKCLNFVLYYEVNGKPYFYRPICLEGTIKHERKLKRQKTKN